ncbi:MAG: hypothetical protein Edafosvirus21_13 [Edafosvirus sp.]|uniref:Transmembrane protein n=1 Tax=Edafosvirus sp. TaxID=2487765 RepID=A0A3G4ZWA2_9VIRU|nr:MAG: hypothetical protein Edafosvirus21_13 [Edafosvirus sp.]
MTNMLAKFMDYIKTAYGSTVIHEKNEAQKYFVYQKACIICFVPLYILFVIIRTASEFVELKDNLNVNTNIYIIQQIFWFFACVLLLTALYIGENQIYKSIRIVTSAWISILCSVLITASIPYSASVGEPKIDYTNIETMWATMLQNLTSVWPTIQYTMLFLFAFAYGIIRASNSIPDCLVRFGIKKPTEINGLSFLTQFGATGFISGYLIAQRWSFIDPAVPFYLVLWNTITLLKLIKNQNIKKYMPYTIYGIKGLIIFFMIVKLITVYGFAELFGFIWLNFVLYIVPLLLTIISSLIVIVITSLMTRLMFIAIYVNNYDNTLLPIDELLRV